MLYTAASGGFSGLKLDTMNGSTGVNSTIELPSKLMKPHTDYCCWERSE